MSIIHVVSVSSGKDSDETLRQCLARFPKDRVRAVIADTGNEHPLVWEHIAYLEKRFGIKVTVLRADFTSEIMAKRKFIARDQRTRREYDTRPVFEADGITPVPKRDGRGQIVLNKKGKPVQKTVKVGGGRKVRWSNKAKRRALAVLWPSGNPYLDLCMWKGRFPSRKAQFCTQELKTALLVEYQQTFVEAGNSVVSWQGVRRDESANRRDAKKFETLNPRTYAYRPLVDWTASMVFASLAAHDVEVNGLYRLGMNRVGCMPCINVAKAELREIAIRWPGEIERIAEWEPIVGNCSKRGFSTFSPDAPDAPDAPDRRDIFERANIYARVEWSNTTRGGKQLDLISHSEEVPACKSSYGLCE